MIVLLRAWFTVTVAVVVGRSPPSKDHGADMDVLAASLKK